MELIPTLNGRTRVIQTLCRQRKIGTYNHDTWNETLTPFSRGISKQPSLLTYVFVSSIKNNDVLFLWGINRRILCL